MIDQTKYLLAIFRDITERQQAEQHQAKLLKQVEKANRELKEFAYVASHDLKAPLRGISSLAGWLSTDYGDKLGDKGMEQMNLLLSRVDRMQKLIDGILQYSRVGQTEEEKVHVDLNELVPVIIDSLAPPENIEITVETELPVLECGQTRITQAFQNLLSNAVKYMDKPHGQIRIGCVEKDNFWEFNVTDNGPGIEEEHFERIFQIFQTLARHDENGGTGIGLTVVKKIVELYDGKIWVESKLGEGSTFYFTLPKEMGVKNEKLEANIVGGRR
jgi:light-regulated signal transduction histidine kinase (bacteriophytochrome)